MAFILPFLITCLIIEATPGPNMGYLAVLSASRGRRAGFAAMAGVACGLLVIGLAAAFGAAVVISNSPFLYQLLRWGGVVYMLYLAWESWREDPEFETKPVIEEDAKYFWRGFITNVLNPKAVVFYVAVLPTFIVPGPSIYAQSVMLTLLYVMVATAVHGAIVGFAGLGRGYLQAPGRKLLVQKVFAVMLAGIAVWMFLKT